MPYPTPDEIVQFFTGPLDTSTNQPLASALKIAIDDYPGHLSGAANLGAALAILDVLAASGDGFFIGFSSDNSNWRATPQTGDRYLRFATGQTRPDESGSSWSIGIDVTGPQGVRGPFLIRQYRHATTTPADPTGGSYDLDTDAQVASTDWSVTLTAPGAGENTYFVQYLIDPSSQSGLITPTWSVVLEAGGTGPPGTPGVTLAELFAALLAGSGISFDDSVQDERRFAVDATIARLADPAFTGNPTVPTAPLGDDDQSAVNSQWTQREIAGLVDTVQVASATLTVTDRDGTSRSYTLPGSSGIAGGTGDLQIEELLNRQTSLNLPAGHVWVGTGLTPPATLEILLVDASDATDDYEVVDWDGVKSLAAGVIGQPAAANTFHTFQAHIQDITYEIRIGQAAGGEILLAANQNAALALPELRLDRMLAPIEALAGTVHGNIQDWAVRDSGVQQTAPDAWTITTGQNIAALSHGDRFYFRSPVDNAGPISLTIDSLAPLPIMKLGAGAASIALAAGDLEANRPIEVGYDQENAVLVILGGELGTAAYRSFGVTDGDVPLLGNNGLLDLARIPTGITQGQIALLGLGGVFDTERLAPGGTPTQLLERTAAGMLWADRPVEANDFVDTAVLSLNGTSQLLLTLGRTGTLADIVTAPLTLPLSGLTAVATDTGFGGDGSTGDPLTLDTTGADFPIIPLAKGGLGTAHADVASIRNDLGLGTAAILNTGVDAGDIPVLAAGGLLDSARLAPDGAVNDVLTRTTNGQVWTAVSAMGVDTNDYVDTAVLALNASNELVMTLGRTGTLADIVTAPLVLAAGADGTVSGLTMTVPNNILTVSIASTTGGPVDGTVDLSLLTFAAGAVTSGTFPSIRLANGPDAGEFLRTNGTNNVWDNIAPSDIHGGADGQFVRSDGSVGSWSGVLPGDLAANGADTQLLSIVSGVLGWVSAAGLVVVDSIIDGIGITADMPTGNVTLSLEPQFRGRVLGTVADPQFVLTLGTYAIRLEIAGVPTAAADYGVGDTFTFHVPDPVVDVGGDNTPLSLLPGTSGGFIDIVSPLDGSVLTRSDLVAGALHTVRLNHAGDFALVEPEIAIVRSLTEGLGIDLTSSSGNTNIAVEAQYLGRQLGDGFASFSLSLAQYVVDMDIPGAPGTGYATGDTLTFVVPDPITNLGTATTPLSVRVNTGGEIYFVVSAADRSRLIRSDLVPGGLHTVRFNQANEFALVEPSTIGGDTGGGVNILNGSANPDDADGVDADWYLNTTSGTWFEKVAGSWVSRYTDRIGQAGTLDGVVSGISMANTGIVTVTRTVGADLTSDFSGAIASLISTDALLQSQNLADLNNIGTARTNLGVLDEAEVDARAVLRFTNAEKSKLSGIEALATTDQTPVEIKTDYESNTDTNAFTDALLAKLNGIMENAAPPDGVVDTVGLSVANQVLEVTLGRTIGSDIVQTVTLPESGGTGRFFGVPRASVGGTATAITLTTGRSLAGLQHGDTFFWHSRHNTNASATVAVDGLNAQDIRKSDGQGGGSLLDGGEITDDDPVVIYYDSHLGHFFLGVARAGDAARRNIGTAQHSVPVLGAGGSLDNDIITASGLALLDSPALTGIPTAPTAALGDNSTLLATTAFVLANASTTGFTLRQGTGNPANSLGADGDWYLNTTAGSWHEKVSGSWVDRYTDQVGAAGGLTQDQVDARVDLLALLQVNNLSDVGNVATARTNLAVLNEAEVDARAALRFTDAQVAKLAGIEAGATEDQSDSEIKVGYEANPDTNAFTDALLTKLNGIMENAAPADGVVDSLTLSLNGQALTVTLGRSIGADLTRTVTLPSGGGGTSDGVVDGISMENSGVVTVTRTIGADVTSDFSTAIMALINAAYVRGLLNLTANQADRIVVGGSFSGRALSLSRNNTGDQNIQLPILTADEAIDSTHTGWSLINGQILVGALDSLTLRQAQNLADLDNAATARTNLGVLDQAGVDGRIDALALRQAQNLADLDNVATARTNLGVLNQGQVDARVTHVASDAFHSASFSNLSRRLTFGRLGGGTSSVPLNFLNSYAGADPPTNLEYEGGDTVQVNGDLYFYTGTLATIATSAIPTHANFINLSEGGLSTVATGAGLDGDGSVGDPIHIPNDGLVLGMYSNNSIGLGILRNASVTRQNLQSNNVPNNVRTTLGYDMGDAQFTWKAVAELTGATFTGDVFGISAATGDDSLRFATTEWVRDHLVSNLPTGTGRYYRITNANVAGTANAIELTTGETLSSLNNGDQFFFRSNHTPTGATTVTIDGLSAVSLRLSDGDGGSREFEGQEFTSDDPVLMVYDADAGHLFLLAARVGTAAFQNVGTDQGELAALGSNGRFPLGRMPSNVLRGLSISADDRTLFATQANGTQVNVSLASRYALLAGSTFTGGVHGVTAGDSDDSDLFATTEWVRDHLTANPSNGSARYFGIPDSDVGGSGNAITLTTGQDISALRNGDTFFFRSADGVTGAVQIAVDSLNSRQVRISNGSGGSQNLQGDEWTSNDPVTVVYESTANQFFLAGTRVGIAAFKNTGASAGDIPLLGGGGRLSVQRLPTVAALTSGANFTGATTGLDPVADFEFVTLRYFNQHAGTPVTAHDLFTGWSPDTTVTESEVLAGASSSTDTVTIPNATGGQYHWIWRADADGGDPTEVHVAGGGNGRNGYGVAMALTVDGDAGQLIVSVIQQNADFLSGETLRVV